MNDLARLLKPRSVAVIGASADPLKTAGRPVAYLRKHGFSGRIYPVNPRIDRIGDLACYPDIAALPEVPDVGIVLLGIDHERFTFRTQGLDFRLTGVEKAKVIRSLVA